MSSSYAPRPQLQWYQQSWKPRNERINPSATHTAKCSYATANTMYGQVAGQKAPAYTGCNPSMSHWQQSYSFANNALVQFP